MTPTDLATIRDAIRDTRLCDRATAMSATQALDFFTTILSIRVGRAKGTGAAGVMAALTGDEPAAEASKPRSGTWPRPVL